MTGPDVRSGRSPHPLPLPHDTLLLHFRAVRGVNETRGSSVRVGGEPTAEELRQLSAEGRVDRAEILLAVAGLRRSLVEALGQRRQAQLDAERACLLQGVAQVLEH